MRRVFPHENNVKIWASIKLRENKLFLRLQIKTKKLILRKYFCNISLLIFIFELSLKCNEKVWFILKNH